MTTQPDLDQALVTWLRDVPPHSDRARVAVLAQLGATRQHRPRPSWLYGTRAAGPRHTPGRSSLSAMRPLALVALIALGTGAVYLAAGQSPSPVPSALVATPSPTEAPSATSSPPTEAPSTKPLTGLLARLVTQEVEPGVLRVVSDGYRDVSLHLYSAPATWDSGRQSNVVAGPDGSVWLFGADEWYRLGEEATYPVTDETLNGQMAQVTPDGTLWTLAELDGDNFSTLVSFEDGSWTVRKGSVGAFDVEPDGTVWVSTGNGITRLRDASQAPEAGDGETDLGQFWVSPVVPPAEVGDVEFVVLSARGPDSKLGRWWFREDGEPHGDVVDGVLPVQIDAVDMDPHGALWIYQTLGVPVAGTWEGIDDPKTRTIHYLVHVAAESVVYTDDQGVPAMGDMRAAPDGSVWLTPRNGSSRCGGIANFDGTTWTRYLSGRCVVAFDISPDGTVWLQATPEGNTFSEEPDEADTTETLVIPS